MLVLGGASGAFAQSRSSSASPQLPRGYVLAGAGFATEEIDFEDHSTFTANAESSSIDVDYDGSGKVGLDVAAGFRLWKSFGARIGVNRTGSDAAAAVSASIAHPFFFNRARTAETEVSGLQRHNTTIDAHASVGFLLGRTLQVSVFAGPSWLHVKQDVVVDVPYTDAFPYDSITLGTPVVRSSSASKVGFGGGVDVLAFLTRTVGIGGSVRMSRANLLLETANGAETEIKAGGPTVGVGIVVRIP